jgi:hypothetical protein
VTGDGEQSHRLVSDAVDDQAEEDDAQCKRPHARAIDGSLLRLGEIEGGLQFANRVGSHAKDEGSGYEGYEAGPEQSHIGFAAVGLAHRVCLLGDAPVRKCGGQRRAMTL